MGLKGIGVFRGAGLYVGALIGPGLLLVPALALRAAGPASMIAWAGLLILSAPLAATFATLGVKYPVAGGVSAYVEAGFGTAAGNLAGVWFIAAIFLGAPAVSLIGGFYVADLTGSGSEVAVVVAIVIFAAVIASNASGLRISSTVQLALSATLVGLLAVALGVALPARGGSNWTPFAPHGWLAVGTAANILVWQFVGWEAVAQLAGDFRRPTDLPRAMAVAFAVVTVLYMSLAIATVGVGSSSSAVPLADLVAVGFGRAGRLVTAVLAVALTMGTMNVYMGGGAKLAAALAHGNGLPRWLGAGARRTVPLRPLVLFAIVGASLLVTLAAGKLTATDLIRATASLFIAIYVLAIASAIRILRGRDRGLAIVSVAMVAMVAMFSSWYALVPLAVGALSILQQWAVRRRRAGVFR